MKKEYIIQETEEMGRILDETYDEVMAALRQRNPTAESLVEDDELSQLHDLLALLRLGQIRIGRVEDTAGRYIILLEVVEDR